MLIFLLACAGEPALPAALNDCGDAACREAWVLAAYERGGAAAAAEGIRALPGPEEQLAVAGRLFEAHPGQTLALCAALPPGPSRSRCERVNDRPHLWYEAPVDLERSQEGRPGGGPSSVVLWPTAALDSRWHAVLPAGDACSDAADVNSCLAERATDSARRGADAQAARLCAAMTGEKWRSECFFNVAEGAVGGRGRSAYAQAVEHCLAAGPFGSNCLAHASIVLSLRTPDASQTDRAAWADTVATAETIASAWVDRDPAFADTLVDRWWSDVSEAAYAATPVVTGEPLHHLPVAAARHVRSAAVRRLVALEPTAASDLAGWVAAAEAALARGSSEVVPRGPPPKVLPVVDRWPSDLPGEQTWPATFFTGTARRTWSEDAGTDTVICVLETLARLEPRPDAVLAEGRSWPDPAIQWTTARLLDDTRAGEAPSVVRPLRGGAP